MRSSKCWPPARWRGTRSICSRARGTCSACFPPTRPRANSPARRLPACARPSNPVPAPPAGRSIKTRGAAERSRCGRPCWAPADTSRLWAPIIGFPTKPSNCCKTTTSSAISTNTAKSSAPAGAPASFSKSFLPSILLRTMMTTRRNNSARLAGGAALLGSLLCASFGHAEPLSTELRELRQKEIAQKSEAERARLMRNFKDFRALPVEEQERLRAFNRELKDDARNQGRLKAVMDEYYDWLATLTPGEQFDLRKEADPNRREKRVRDLLREQQEHVDATGARGAKSPKGLSSKDLAAVLGVIESAITKQQLLSAEETQRLHEKR